MAKMDFDFSFDPTEYLRLYREAMSSVFLMMTDFDSLESGLNEIGITFTEDGETE